MYWVQQFCLAPMILALIVLVSMLPARHVLLPLWPRPVDELVVLDAERGSSVRQFVNLGQVDGVSNRILARTRPSSVIAVEYTNGSLIFGYPVGLGPTSAEGLPKEAESGMNATLARSKINPYQFRSINALPPSLTDLQLLDANDHLLELENADIVRLYYPNRLTLADRFKVLIQRASDCWLDPCDLH